MRFVRTILAVSIGLLTVPAFAQQQAAPPQEETWAQAWERRLHEDFAYLSRYRDDNAKLTPAAGKPRIVFMGDSITEGWVAKDPAFFTPGRIGRGISGQTTSQMLLRFRQDVINLHPDVVQIMAGTNDVAGNTGPATDEQIQDNIRSMVELAHAHGIRVILASIPPAGDFPWKPGLNPGPRIAKLNDWLKSYAAESGCVYADYWSVLHEGVAFHAGWSSDGVHPNEQGYAVMDKVAESAIAQALKHPKPKPIA
jgi:lysophospholipase L1-like esterase